MKRLLLNTVPGLLLVLLLGACAPPATEQGSGPESVETFENATYSHPLNDTETVTVTLAQSIWDTTITTLDDDELLIDAEFDFVGEMVFDVTGMVEKEVIIEQNNEDEVYDGDEAGSWRIAIAPDVTSTFDITGSLGPLDADLSELNVSALTLDMGSGAATIELPPSDDGIVLDITGSIGDLRVSVPDDTALTSDEPVNLSVGTTTFDFGAGASWDAALVMSTGNVVLDVAEDAAVRVTITEASVGAFDPQIEMTQVEENEDGTGVWETPDYDDADPDAAFDISVAMSIGDLIIE